LLTNSSGIGRKKYSPKTQSSHIHINHSTGATEERNNIKDHKVTECTSHHILRKKNRGNY